MNKKKLLITFVILLFFSCKKNKPTKAITIKKKAKTSEITRNKKAVTADNSTKNNSVLEEKIIKSDDFYISEIDKSSIDFSNSEATLYLHYKSEGRIISEINIDTEYYNNDTRVFEITNHNLDNVKRVISFEIAECPCACTFTIIYILETIDNRFIELPSVSYDAEENIQPQHSYRFGKKNTIYTIEKTFHYIDSEIELKAINRYKKLLWNGFRIINTINLSQKSYKVTAKKGLVVRDKPSLKGKKIGLFAYKTQVIVKEKTNNTLELFDEGQLIKGNWVKVENYTFDNWVTGYVFDGFLEKYTTDYYQ